jgi:hypothetical protein
MPVLPVFKENAAFGRDYKNDILILELYGSL